MVKDKESQHEAELLERTKAFAVRVVRFCSSLPKSFEAQVLARQLLRTGTTVGALYREAVQANSSPALMNQVDLTRRKLDQTVYWLDLLAEGGIVEPSQAYGLRTEAHEIKAMLGAAPKTAAKKGALKIRR